LVPIVGVYTMELQRNILLGTSYKWNVEQGKFDPPLDSVITFDWYIVV
jgi:hypothetical protein